MSTLTPTDLSDISRALTGLSPAEVVRWGLDWSAGAAVVSTNFRPMAAVTLHIVTRVAPQIPVLWVDTGHSTPATYRFADRLSRALDLNLQVYQPRLTRARWEALHGGVPSVYDEEAHARFTQDVKLEPFQRALRELKPRLWFSGIRRSQTKERESMGIASYTGEGILKVSPVYDFTDADMERYLLEHDLPDEKDYFDPTKVLANRECGLHLSSAGL
jgi:phosphoadenosine phosphosulfate reductase